jgi:hypothetical protein
MPPQTGLQPSVNLGYPTQFSVVNRSSFPIRNIYVSPTSASNWGPDQLGSDWLLAGGTMTFYFPTPTAQCNYDFRVVLQDGRSSDLMNVDLCVTPVVTYN